MNFFFFYKKNHLLSNLGMYNLPWVRKNNNNKEKKEKIKKKVKIGGGQKPRSCKVWGECKKERVKRKERPFEFGSMVSRAYLLLLPFFFTLQFLFLYTRHHFALLIMNHWLKTIYQNFIYFFFCWVYSFKTITYAIFT